MTETTVHWQDVGRDYKIQFAETDDPRLVAVIQRDDEWGGDHIDGDVYAPAFYWDRYWGKIEAAAGHTYTDDESRQILERMIEGRSQFQHRRMHSDHWERWARIYYATTFEQVSSSIDRDAQVVILNTPSWRKHIGLPDERAFEDGILNGDVHDWTAALDGDVFGIGYAVNEARRLPSDEPIDLEDGEWDINIECWGFLGEEYAKEAALEMESGSPNLPEMLPIEVPA